MAKGEVVFTKEELDAVYAPIKQFFADGVTREIVILSKELVKAISQAGKEYTRVDWVVADAKTLEPKEIKFDFGFTNAMRPHKEVMRFETSHFNVTPVKTGEYNGYDRFDYSVEYVGEKEGAVIPKAAETAKDVGF